MTLSEATEIRNRIAALRGLHRGVSANYRSNDLRERFLAETEAEIADLNAQLARSEWL